VTTANQCFSSIPPTIIHRGSWVSGFRLSSSFTKRGPHHGPFIHGAAATPHISWNNGKLVGQKAPLKLKAIWANRVRLQIANRARELALFNLAIESN
jgi:hypothetical protein